MVGSGFSLVTTVIAYGMSATFIVFICARLICVRVRSGGSSSAAWNNDGELQSDLDQEEYAVVVDGLEPVVVAAIPTVKYNSEDYHSKEDAQCSICLGDYKEKEMLRIMPTCHHNFHLACIDVWLQKQSTCPICRLPLNGSFEAKFSSTRFIALRSGDSSEVPSGHSIHESRVDEQEPGHS